MHNFMTKAAKSYSLRGVSGKHYLFNPVKPTKVEEKDSPLFRKNRCLLECDEEGNLVGPRQGSKAQPVSYTKFSQHRVTTSGSRENLPPPRGRGR